MTLTTATRVAHRYVHAQDQDFSLVCGQQDKCSIGTQDVALLVEAKIGEVLSLEFQWSFASLICPSMSPPGGTVLVYDGLGRVDCERDHTGRGSMTTTTNFPLKVYGAGLPVPVLTEVPKEHRHGLSEHSRVSRLPERCECKRSQMNTIPIVNEVGRVTGFQIENIYVSPRTVARILGGVDGVSSVRTRRPFSAWEETHVWFVFRGAECIVWEPFGDNSLYWIGQRESPDPIDMAAVEDAFKAYSPPVHRKVIGDIATLQFVKKLLGRDSRPRRVSRPLP